MADWAWLVVDLDGTDLDDLQSATRRSVTWRLRDQGDAEIRIASTADGPATQIRELRTDLLVTYGGRGLWRGRFGGSDDEADETGETLEVGAVDYRGVLDARLTLEDLSWESIDLAEAAWRLVRHTQYETGYAGGLLGPGLGRGPLEAIATGAVEVPQGRPISEAIDDLGKRLPGFDWWTDADMLLQISHWRGSATPRDFALIYRETATTYRRSLDVTGYANLVLQTGGDELDPAIAAAADLGTDARPEGRWEVAAANPDLRTQGDVDDTAPVVLSRASVLTPQRTFRVRPGLWTPDDLWVGDLVRIVAKTHREDLDSLERVTEITVTDEGNGPEVDITVGNTLAADVAAMLRRLPARLTQLARRT